MSHLAPEQGMSLCVYPKFPFKAIWNAKCRQAALLWAMGRTLPSLPQGLKAERKNI